MGVFWGDPIPSSKLPYPSMVGQFLVCLIFERGHADAGQRAGCALMVVPGNSFCLSNTLIFDGRLQHYALTELVDEIALDFCQGVWLGG